MKKTITASESRRSPLSKSIDVVLSTEDGRALWAYLFHACGYNATSLTIKGDREVAQLSTECKEAQRKIYIDLRNLASRELRAKAEELAETSVAVPDVTPEEERKK